MSWEEVKKQTEALTKSFEDFKKTNDAEIAAIKSNSALGEIKEKSEKHASAITEMEQKLEKAIAALNRKGATAEASQKEVNAEAKSIINEIMRKNTVSEEKNARLLELCGQEFKLLSVQNETEGGFLVRPDVSNEIQAHLYEMSPMRQLAEVQVIGSDAFEEAYESEDEVGAGWVGETQDRTETVSKKLKLLRIPAHEMYAEPKATQKMLDDSFFDVESWHKTKVLNKMARQEAAAFINGDGVLKPKGLLSYAAGDGFDKLEQVATAASGVLAANDLIDVQEALFEAFQANAAWLMARSTRSALRKLKDSQGRYLFSIDSLSGLNGGTPFMLLDKPIYLAPDMPAVTNSALSIAYGDFKQGYKIVDRMGISVIRDALTQKGFVKFYTTKRVGGGVQQFQAIKLLKIKA